MSDSTEQIQDMPEGGSWGEPIDMILDPEAMFLSALMWAADDSEVAERVCGVLTADDFYNMAYAEIFSLMLARREKNEPIDAVSLQSAFHTLGDTSPLPLSSARETLLALATLGAAPQRLFAYADQVLGTSYRRQFQAMAGNLVHVAETAPEDQLFEIMVEHGKRQRHAWARRQQLTTNPEQ